MHVVPTQAHEIFMFQKFGLVDKTFIMEHMGDDVRKWVEFEMGLEKRTSKPWYNTPTTILAQLVWQAG